MTKKLKKVHEPVAERGPEDKPKFVEVHDRNPLFDAGRRVALASVGAVALASDEFENLVNKLIERGEIVETDGRKRLKEMTERMQEQMRPAEMKTVDASKYLPYADNVESVPADEQDDIRKVVQSIEQILQESRAEERQAAP